MIYIDNITKKSDLENNDSESRYGIWKAQQNHNSYETFFDFIKEVRPKRILEIGTAWGGLTSFINDSCLKMKIDCEILTLDINEYPWYQDMKNAGIDIRIENVFSPEYDSVSQYIIDFIKSNGVTIILCDGGNKIKEFNLLSNFLKPGDFIMAHDYSENQKKFENEVYMKVWNWFEISDSDIEESCNKHDLVSYNKENFDQVAWVCKKKRII